MGNYNLFLPARLLKQKPIYKARDLYTGIKKGCVNQLHVYVFHNYIPFQRILSFLTVLSTLP